MTPASQKRALRRATIERILSLDPALRAKQDAALVLRFATLPGLADARVVLLYVTAFPEEIPTRPLLRQVRDLGKTLVCPRVDRAERRLRLFQVDDIDSDLVPGAMGIPEPRSGCKPVDPSQVDWLLVPGLAFDPLCHRIGRGAGHYDKLLPTFRPETPRLALIYDEQWIDAIPVEAHDVQLDGVVSMSRTIVRTG